MPPAAEGMPHEYLKVAARTQEPVLLVAKLALRLSDNVIGQFADSFDFEFDRVACFQEAAHFEAAAAPVCAGFENRSSAGAKKFSRV